MFGAILGDIIGSPYEFDMGNKSKDFPLFRDDTDGMNGASGRVGEGGTNGTAATGTTAGTDVKAASGYRNSQFTDDTVMTIAVADGMKKASRESFNDENVKKCITEALVYWGKRYPDAGYGARFNAWLNSEDHQPYNSYGNGSAMRVSSVGWIANSIDSARRLARATAEVTHNHPEGIKGAEAVASAIFMSRANCTKEEIKTYIVDQFGYDLSRTCDEIRPDYHHVESCQETVPEAITAFLEGEDFEDVIRTAASLGGDCDTLTAIAGSIAEAYYGIPAELKYECYKRLDEDLGTILSQFERSFQFNENTACKYHPIYWFSKDEEGFVQLERPYVKPKKMTRALDGFDTSGRFRQIQSKPTACGPLLLSTGSKVLGEASLNDRKWGIGVDCCDDGRFKVSGWKGQNLLGRALMEVRAELHSAQRAAQFRPADEPATLEYVDLIDADFPEWHMTAGELRCIPQFHNAIHAYSDTLDSRSLRDSFFYVHSLCEWEEILKAELTEPEAMAKSLPIAGFWEMKQEIWEMVKNH